MQGEGNNNLDRDINDVFDDILFTEEKVIEDGYKEGFLKGSTEDNIEGYHLGYHRGAELGAELGYYSGIIETHIVKHESEKCYSEKIMKIILALKKAIDGFPKTNSEDLDILGDADNIRTMYKKKLITCLFKMATEVKKTIENILAFLKKYQVLSEGHMVDFFTKSLYKACIPEGMQCEIDSVGYEKVVKHILSGEPHSETPILNDYIKTAKQFSLYNAKNICLSLEEFRRKFNQSPSEIKFNVFMTSKKSHEVEVLSTIAAAVANTAKTSHLIDIGDGKGYLSSLLALHYEIPVLGVDASYVNTTGAIGRATKLVKHWQHIFKIPKDQEHLEKLFNNNRKFYKQVTQVVKEDTDFDRLVKNVFLEDSTGLGLVGLHTCGNLGPTSIRIFNANNKIKSICNVSCCYHLLNERYLANSDELLDEEPRGFPMSAFLKSQNTKLLRATRMLSAQSIDRILAGRELPNKVIFYRAIFEIVLEKFHETVRGRNVGRFRKEPENFVVYAREAFKRIDVAVDISDDQLEEFYEVFKSRRVQLNVFHLIRSMLAPAIEAVILLDRYLFLLEQGHENVFLVQLFDPVISPRCYGLIAFKNG